MSLAAEFPNDNPDLHDGTIWVCLDVIGAPVAERRFVPPPPVQAEPAPAPEPPPARESGIFMTFSSLADDRAEEEEEEDEEILVEELGPLEDAILEVAVNEAAVIEVEPIVAVEPAPPPAPAITIAPPAPDDAWVVFVGTLVDIAIAHGATAAAAELPRMLEGEKIAQAWAAILRGTSEDWDAIGGSMLDEWAADTLARAIGADAQMLKRELRARGVAAFGLAA